jgi:hypothetical protein
MKKINLNKTLIATGSIVNMPVLTLTGCDNGEKSITATINGTFPIGIEANGTIVVRGHHGVNLNAISIKNKINIGLEFNYVVNGDTLTIEINGVPTSAYSDNLIISGDGVSCEVFLIVGGGYAADGNN